MAQRLLFHFHVCICTGSSSTTGTTLTRYEDGAPNDNYSLTPLPNEHVCLILRLIDDRRELVRTQKASPLVCWEWNDIRRTHIFHTLDMRTHEGPSSTRCGRSMPCSLAGAAQARTGVAGRVDPKTVCQIASPSLGRLTCEYEEDLFFGLLLTAYQSSL